MLGSDAPSVAYEADEFRLLGRAQYKSLRNDDERFLVCVMMSRRLGADRFNP